MYMAPKGEEEAGEGMSVGSYASGPLGPSTVPSAAMPCDYRRWARGD